MLISNTRMVAVMIHAVLPLSNTGSSTITAALSTALVTASCAYIFVVKHVAIRTARAIHSLAVLRLLYLSISFLLLVVLVFFVILSVSLSHYRACHSLRGLVLPGLSFLFGIVEGDVATFGGADADSVFYGDDEDTPVSDFSGLCGSDDGLYGLFGILVAYHDRD